MKSQRIPIRLLVSLWCAFQSKEFTKSIRCSPIKGLGTRLAGGVLPQVAFTSTPP